MIILYFHLHIYYTYILYIKEERYLLGISHRSLLIFRHTHESVGKCVYQETTISKWMSHGAWYTTELKRISSLFHAMPQKIQWPTQSMRQTHSTRWEGWVTYRRQMCSGFPIFWLAVCSIHGKAYIHNISRCHHKIDKYTGKYVGPGCWHAVQTEW